MALYKYVYDYDYDKTERWENIFSHDQLRNYLRNFVNKADYEKLSFKYCSENNFNNVTFGRPYTIERSVLHLNIVVLCQTRLVPKWVTICGRINHLGM